MSGLCNTVSDLAELFLWAARGVAVLETAASLWLAFRRADENQRTHDALGPDFDGLAKVLAALKDLPKWVAVFLAALALVWTATSAPNLCS